MIRKNYFTMEDREGYIRLNSEYDLRNYVTFNAQKKEITVFGINGQNTYAIGELLIDFVTLDDEVSLSLYEEDRLELLENLHLVNASDFDYDLKGVLNEYVENYLKQNHISLDEFAKKVAIYDFVKRHEHIHPYFKLVDLYTSILPVDNTILLNDLLNVKCLKEKALEIIGFCLDMDTEKLNSLTAEKRYFFYAASRRGSLPRSFKSRIITLPDKIPMKDYNVFYKKLPDDFDVSTVWELASLDELKTPQDAIDSTIEFLKQENVQLYDAYEVNSFADIIYLELYQMILNNIAVKKCEWCGKYFVLKGDYGTKYCSRIPKGKKQTCQHLGSTRDFNARTKKSDAYKEYLTAYKRMHARIKYGMLTKKDFKEWNVKALEKTQLCEDSRLPENEKPSLDELKEWLGNK